MVRALVLAASCAATSELAHAAAGGHPHSLGSLGFVTLALVLPMFGVLRRPSPVRMTSAMVGGQLLLHLVWTALDAPVPNRSLHTHHGMQTVAGHAAMTHPCQGTLGLPCRRTVCLPGGGQFISLSAVG